MKMKRFCCALLALLLLCAAQGTALAASIKGSMSPETLQAAGDVTLTLTVYNESSAAMENISISSAYSSIQFDTAGVSIPAGKTYPFSCSVSVGEALLGQTINFDLAWTENGEQRTGQGAVTIARLASASLTASRVASTTKASPGDVVKLTYSLTNTGETPVTVLSVTDKEIGGSKSITDKLVVEVGQTMDIPYDFTMDYNTVTSAPVVTYLDAAGAQQTAKVSELILGMVNAKISVEVEQGTPTADGVPFSISLTNNGNSKISSIRVADELGNKINDASFALAAGESRRLTYSVKTDAERYVVFYVTGTTATTGDAYEDHTKSFVVRKYIDPSLLGLEVSATVLEPLNAAGSIKVRFALNNTGTMEMKNLVISQQSRVTNVDGTQSDKLSELYRAETVAPGETTCELMVYVGEPQEVEFLLELNDPAGTPYTYNAYIAADLMGEPVAGDAAAAQQNVIDSLGASLGSSVSRALTIALIVFLALTLLSGIALIVLRRMELQQKREAAIRRARRERQLREQAGQGVSQETAVRRTPRSRDRE